MQMRNLPSRIFYAPLRATEAAVNKMQVLGRYAEDLLTSQSVKIGKPIQGAMTAARRESVFRRTGKMPALSVAPAATATPKAPQPSGGVQRTKAIDNDDFAPPPRPDRSGDTCENSYSRWAWLLMFAPG
jgi:hypothetical protein